MKVLDFGLFCSAPVVLPDGKRKECVLVKGHPGFCCDSLVTPEWMEATNGIEDSRKAARSRMVQATARINEALEALERAHSELGPVRGALAAYEKCASAKLEVIAILRELYLLEHTRAELDVETY